jgi:large repetitive protein
VSVQGNDQLSFLEGNKEIRYVKDRVLNDNSDYSETVKDIVDRSGNVMTEKVIHYKTGNSVDVAAPVHVSTTPAHNATNVPVNAIVSLLFNEALSPVSVNSGSVYLYDTVLNTQVATSIALSSDGKQISLTPLQPLAVSRQYYAYAYPVQDLAQNQLHAYSYFTTGVATDTQAPVISSVSVDDGQVNIPLNARIRVRFDEPVNIQKLSGAVLLLNGQPVQVETSLSSDRLLLTLTPQQLLEPGAIYQLKVNGIEDLSGNVLAAELTRQFTTSTKVDNIRGSITGRTPASNATNVALNATIEVTLSEIIDPTTVQPRTFVLEDNTENRNVEGRIEIGADKKSLVFVPNQPLKAAHRYYLWSSYHENFFDLAGNSVSYNYFYFNIVNQ